MKILVIGKKGRLQHYTPDASVYADYEICYAPMGASDEDILAVGGDADIILADAIAKVSESIISQMPNLKMIHSEGVGFNGIDVNAAKARHIYVCNCKGMNAGAVAEQAILLMLGLLRGAVTGDRAVREGRQMKVKEAYMLAGSLRELRDCTIGLVGFGDIAKETARLAAAFGAKVVYYDKVPASQETEKAYGVSCVTLPKLLNMSDIVSLHVPVMPETIHMADAGFFAQMKEGSYLINTARGELVDSKALLFALENGPLAGAGLDTIEGEPVQADNVILQAKPSVADRIMYSCHVGGITASSFKRGYDMVWEDIKKVAAGQQPGHVVNQW